MLIKLFVLNENASTPFTRIASSKFPVNAYAFCMKGYNKVMYLFLQ